MQYLNELGRDFLTRIRESSGLESDEELVRVFDFVVMSFVNSMPKDPVPTLSEVGKRFRKALPHLTTQTCLFIEQVKAFNETLWEGAEVGV
jgi:hypothetical protein